MKKCSSGRTPNRVAESTRIAEQRLREKIKQLIVQSLQLQVAAAEIPDEEALFDTGLGIDSTATLEIVFALEAEFGIDIGDDELRVELFDSVASLTRFVAAKLPPGAPVFTQAQEAQDS